VNESAARTSAGHPVVLIHGAATTSRIWRGVTAHLPGLDVHHPDRRSTGSLEQEVTALLPLCAGAVIVGVSGGATLGLALVAAGAPGVAAILHEPAVGSLRPGLLDRVAAAYAEGGVSAFGSALYGPSWQPADAPADPEFVRRDLAMFREFEPAAPSPIWAGRVVITVGRESAPIRHETASLLAQRFGFDVVTIAGCGHAVHLEAPGDFAAQIIELVGVDG
jgi:pimeloyl-ACP methyl ester carboxylesterase